MEAETNVTVVSGVFRTGVRSEHSLTVCELIHKVLYGAMYIMQKLCIAVNTYARSEHGSCGMMHKYTITMNKYSVLCIFMRRFNGDTHRYANYRYN